MRAQQPQPRSCGQLAGNATIVGNEHRSSWKRVAEGPMETSELLWVERGHLLGERLLKYISEPRLLLPALDKSSFSAT